MILLFRLCELFPGIPRSRVPRHDSTSLPLLNYHAVDLARDFSLVDGDICLGYLFEDDSVGVYPARPDEKGYDNGKEICAGNDEDIGNIRRTIPTPDALVDDVGRYY